MKLKRKTILLLVVLSLLCVSLIVGVSYSIYQLDQKQTTPNIIQVGCFTIEFEDYGTDSSTYTNLSLTNSYPISTNTALNEIPYKFKITNTCDYIAKTNIAVNVLKTSSISQLATTQNKTIGDMIDISIKEGNNNTTAPVLLSSLNKGVIRSGDTETEVSYIIRTEYLEKDEEKEYSIWMWVPETINNVEVGNEAQGLTLYSKIDVYSLAVDDAELIEGDRVAYIPNGKFSILDNFTITGGTESGNNVGQDGTFDLVVSGKNLFDYSKFHQSYSMNGINFKNNNDGSFTFAGNVMDNSTLTGWGNRISHNESLRIIFQPGYYNISMRLCSKINELYYGEFHFYLNHFYNNESNDNKYFIQSYIDTRSKFKFTKEMLDYEDFLISPGFIIDVNREYNPGTYCPQLEYGETPTSFEPYKEKRYEIELKDTNGNTINGLSSSDTLKKVNGVWVIDNGTTQTELVSSTQSALNNIEIYDGVSRVWVDDDVLITHISVDYYEN